MSYAPIFTFLKMKPVKWALVVIAIAFVGLPFLDAALPYVFPGARASKGSYLDVKEMKEISLLSVQRLNFSKVVTFAYGTNTASKIKAKTDEALASIGLSGGKKTEGLLTNSLDNAEVYIRRIMRGHVTVSVDFSMIDVTNSPTGKVVVKFPKLVTEPFIDQWIFYDSKGTGNGNTKEITRHLDNEFRKDMVKTALQSNRVERAKRQTERIVKTLYPDMDEFVAVWPDDIKTVATSEPTKASHEQ